MLGCSWHAQKSLRRALNSAQSLEKSCSHSLGLRPDQTRPDHHPRYTHSLTHGHCHQTYFPPPPGRIYSPPVFALLLPSLSSPPPPPHHHHDRLSLCNLSSRDPSSALSVACPSILFVPCVLSLLPFVDRIPLGAKFTRSNHHLLLLVP